MNWQRLLKQLVLDGIREMSRKGGKDARRRSRGPKVPTVPPPTTQDLDEPTPRAEGRLHERPVPRSQSVDYPGDYVGPLTPIYAPNPDGEADPGEIVWTWVPFEEDHSQGKDRPVLIVGRDGGWLIGLQVTSQDHDRDAAQEARAGRYWVDIGSGDWDRRKRPSEVRVNRFIRIDPGAVRRIGAVLERHMFDKVTDGIARYS